MLVDTNVLLRAAQPSHPLHPIAVGALAEFWNALTRPAGSNGLGFTIEEAREELTKLEGFFEILSESAVSYAAWKTLLVTHRVSGVQVHDARLVAVMQAHGLISILTFDTGFSRFPGIKVVQPADIVSVKAGAE